tara:strand:- start:1121 stop:1420 length:300 start_codon:yes stop_codon:yes gene_type:complete
MGREQHDGLGEAIGVVNQFITKLEIEAEQPTGALVDSQRSIEYPGKVTLNCLYNHVTVKLWLTFVGILIAAFSLGLAFSEKKLYGTIKSEIYSSQENPE